jgi:hypothetical protein
VRTKEVELKMVSRQEFPPLSYDNHRIVGAFVAAPEDFSPKRTPHGLVFLHQTVHGLVLDEDGDEHMFGFGSTLGAARRPMGFTRKATGGEYSATKFEIDNFYQGPVVCSVGPDAVEWTAAAPGVDWGITIGARTLSMRTHDTELTGELIGLATNSYAPDCGWADARTTYSISGTLYGKRIVGGTLGYWVEWMPAGCTYMDMPMVADAAAFGVNEYTNGDREILNIGTGQGGWNDLIVINQPKGGEPEITALESTIDFVLEGDYESPTAPVTIEFKSRAGTWLLEIASVDRVENMPAWSRGTLKKVGDDRDIEHGWIWVEWWLSSRFENALARMAI